MPHHTHTHNSGQFPNTHFGSVSTRHITPHQVSFDAHISVTVMKLFQNFNEKTIMKKFEKRNQHSKSRQHLGNSSSRGRIVTAINQQKKSLGQFRWIERQNTDQHGDPTLVLGNEFAFILELLFRFGGKDLYFLNFNSHNYFVVGILFFLAI